MSFSARPRETLRQLRGRLRSALARRLGVDPRALVALRVSLGLLLLADLLMRSRWLVAFYTDAGVFPRAVLRARYPLASAVSLHALSGEAWWIGLLFLAAGAAALALLVGRRTRLAAVCSLVLLVSLHARNPLVLNGGDSLLRRTLLWATFLPLGAGLSRAWPRRRADDRVREGDASERDEAGARRARVLHPAAAALVVQPVVVYAVNAVIKLRGTAWPSGSAVRTVFALDAFTVLLGDALAGHGDLLAALGVTWLALLCCSPLLVVTTGRRRLALLAAFASAHLGMALTLKLGLFPLVCLAALVPLVPPTAWDHAERTCSTAANRLPWRVRVRSRVDARTDGGRTETERGPAGDADGDSGERAWGRKAGGVLAAVLLVGALCWNATALGVVEAPDVEAVGVAPDETRWDMFAPAPPDADVWYVAPGRTAAGERVDAFVGTGERVTWARPAELSAAYPSARWRKYLETLRWRGDDRLHDRLAAALCERWNARHEASRHLERVRVGYVSEPARREPVSGRDGEPTNETRTVVAARRCG